MFFFKKSILKQQHVMNAAKSTEIDVWGKGKEIDDQDKVKKDERSYLNVHFFFTFPIFESWFGQYLILYDKQMKGYREKDVVNNAWIAPAKDLEFIENGENNFILLFMLYLRQPIIRALRRVGNFVLFSRKNNQEGQIRSQRRIEPSRSFAMQLFCESN